jgi:DNA-directed RNA polymerase subunit M/transcription elongation factor TFIIS
MGSIDHAGEWLRLSEHYRQMTDGELMAIARDREQLTEIAQQMLAMELSARRLKIESVNPQPTKSTLAGALQPKHLRLGGLSDRNARPARDYAASEVDPYAKDREPVEILTVWSLRDALQVQRMLDVASIPFYMGDEATGADAAALNFSNGVSVKVMRVGVPWALQALEHYDPKDVPESEKWHWDEEVDVRCPTCRSKDITFEELVASADSASHRYKWTCSHCGYKWEDDGVARV